MLPSGPGDPAPEAAGIWSTAAAGCRSVQTYSGELRVSGRVGSGSKFKATVLAGLTSSGEIRLEAPAPFGRAAFVLAGTSARATLLSRDDRVLTASSDKIIEALVGLPLAPRALMALLNGCAGEGEAATESLRYADTLVVGTPSARLYLRQTAGTWRVVATEMSGLLVEYLSNVGGWPADLRIASQPGRTPVIGLTVAIHQVEVNSTMPASTFSVAVPAAATPLSLEELRAAGPLGDKRK